MGLPHLLDQHAPAHEHPLILSRAMLVQRQRVQLVEEGVEFVLDDPGRLGARAGLGARDEAGRVLLGPKVSSVATRSGRRMSLQGRQFG